MQTLSQNLEPPEILSGTVKGGGKINYVFDIELWASRAAASANSWESPPLIFLWSALPCHLPKLTDTLVW